MLCRLLTTNLIILVEKITGTVINWFNIRNGYGTIKRWVYSEFEYEMIIFRITYHRDDNNDEVFVHKTAIIKKNPRQYSASLAVHEKVEFDIVQGRR